MTPDLASTAPEVPCHRCGYDLRAHPPDGKCPECAASIAESRRLSAIPRRPPWRDSDPRWRWHILFGIWLLALLPLQSVLLSFCPAYASLPIPNLLHLRGGFTVEDSFVNSVYEPLLFCMGFVLLFSKERGRRPARLDWTRRWGVFCTSVVLLLSAARVLFLVALVVLGIAALFLSMPPRHQPGVTPLLVNLGWFYLHYGPFYKNIAAPVHRIFASVVVLLACVPLFHALRSSGSRWLPAILLSPLALLSVTHVAQAGWQCVLMFTNAPIPNADLIGDPTYINPDLMIAYIAGDRSSIAKIWQFTLGDFLVELTKWLFTFAIATWLAIAQLMAWRHPRSARAPQPATLPNP